MLTEQFADCKRKIDKLSINGITTKSYIMGYENRRVKNASSNSINHRAIVNQPNKMITLHILKVDPKSCDTIDMFAYSSHLVDSGECKEAQSAFMGISHFEGYGKLFDKKDWFVSLKSMMQMQYDVGNLERYWHFKKFWNFLTK